MNKLIKLNKIIWLLVIVLGVFNLFRSNNLAVKSFQLSQIEQQIRELETSNRLLTVDIANQTQLGAMEKLALNQGFTRNVDVVYPNLTSAVALR